MATGWIAPVVLECPGIVRTIRLEPLDRRHAADLHAAADQELFRHSMQAPIEWTVRGFEMDVDKINSTGGVVGFAMVLIESGRAIGRTTYMEIKPEHRSVEIGRTWIGRAYHGTHVNPEAKYLMLRHAFETVSPPAIRVQLTTGSLNVHSQAAIAKLGAIREGVHRKARIMPPTVTRPEPVVQDVVCFSIVEDQWPAVKAALEARLG